MIINALLAAGFSATTYQGQQGVLYTKRLPVRDMARLRETFVDNEYVFDDDEAIVEFVPDPVFPGGGVQVVIVGTDIFAEAEPFTSKEGRALLEDAGVDLALLQQGEKCGGG